MDPATPRSVRRRRRTAASLLSWALTLASLASLAGAVLLTIAASPAASTAMATQDGVRLHAADWVIGVVETTTGQPASVAPSALADAFDDEALAQLLSDNISGVFSSTPVTAIPLSMLAPSITPQELGLPPGSDLKLLPVLPNVAWLPQPLTWAALAAAVVAALLGLAAMFVAYPHQRSYVVARLGRWLLSTCIVAAALYAVAVLLGPQFGLLGAYLAAVAADLASSGLGVLLAGLAGAVALLLLAFALRRRQARRVAAEVDTAEPQLPTAAQGHTASDPATSEPAPAAPITDPSWALPPLPAPVRPALAAESEAPPSLTPHWARPGWPQPIEGFAPSELTREATAEELEHAAVASCRAWVAGNDADPDDAEILHLVLTDRGNFIQLARLWSRYDGMPRACANVVLAYTDLSLHIQEYSALLGIADWAMHNRVGTLRRGVQDKGVEVFAADLRTVYQELAAALPSPLADRERTRLLKIGDALAFVPVPAHT